MTNNMFRPTLSIYLVLLLALLQITGTVALPPMVRESSVDEQGVPQTNAARMALGLPPLAPRHLHGPPTGTTGQNPSVPETSNLPITGKILIKNAKNGKPVGYVSKSYSGNGKKFIPTTNSNQAMVITFIPTTSGPFDIHIDNPLKESLPFLGFAGGNVVDGIDPKNLHWLTRTAHTNPGPPKKVGNAYDNGKSASAIWNYKAGSKKLTPVWTNSGGAKPHVQLWYFPSKKVITFVSSEKLAKKFDPKSFPITFNVIV